MEKRIKGYKHNDLCLKLTAEAMGAEIRQLGTDNYYLVTRYLSDTKGEVELISGRYNQSAYSYEPHILY